MKNKKGLTLVEIIVAIALLGIVGVLLLPALTNQFVLLKNTRNMTSSLYAAQQQIEQVINDVKKSIQAGTNPEGQVKTSYTLFEGSAQRSVYGYPNKISIYSGNNKITLNAVIADQRMPDFDVATASNVKIQFYNGSSYLNNAYVKTPSLSIVSSFNLSDPKHVNLTNISRWYVSREGFNSPMIQSPLEIENGTVYPRFPDDYVLIPNTSSSNLNDVRAEYAGRHIAYTVTPASQSGKMGETVPSNPLFISGLPIIDNLVLHLDASMLSREDNSTDGSIVTTSGQKYVVKQWGDISGNKNHAKQSTTINMPELLDMKTGYIVANGITYETRAKYLQFSGGQGMTISDSSSLRINNLTIFVVAKSSSTTANKTIVSKTSSLLGWFLGWTGENQLGITLRTSLINSNSANGMTGAGLDNKWHILTATSGLTFQIDSTTPVTQTRTVGSVSNSSGLYIGFDGGSNYSTIDIAEIIIYNKVLSLEDQYKINTYLTNKYTPNSPEVYIYALKPINDSAVIGEPYILPSTIPAYMTNGTLMNVPVTWSINPIDTSTPGLKTSVATSVTDPSKTTTAKIDVAGIDCLNNIDVTVMQYDSYLLPTSAVATLTNGKTCNTPVTWNINNVDTSILGTQQRIGTSTVDPSKTMTLTITVAPKSVRGVSIDQGSQTIPVGGTCQLTVTTVPADAYNKTVTWESNNPAIASIDPSSGLVTAISSGYATITATTADGGFTDTCDITVTVPVSGISLDKTRIVIYQNRSFQLTATVIPDNATNKNVIWSTSNSSVVTVSSTGYVTSKNVNGNATITATTEDGGYTATCYIIVGIPVTGVSVSPANGTIKIGEQYSLTAKISPSNPNPTVKTVTWSSSDPSVASVSSIGVVTGIKAGTATITVKTDDGDFTDQCAMTVIKPVTGVTVSPSSLSLPCGSTETLTVQITPADATIQDVTWSSSNANYVTVTSSGVVKATTYTSYIGRYADITVKTVDGNYTATCRVTVGSKVTGVSLNKTSLTLQQGTSETLTATVYPSDAGNKSVTWSSSDTAVATVSNSGAVSAISGGTTSITVTTVDGGYTAQCTVIVPLYATEISGGARSVTLTFNKFISSGSITTSGVNSSVSGKTITFTKSSGFNDGTYTVSVIATDGSIKNVNIRLSYSWLWGWDWSIESQQ